VLVREVTGFIARVTEAVRAIHNGDTSGKCEIVSSVHSWCRTMSPSIINPYHFLCLQLGSTIKMDGSIAGKLYNDNNLGQNKERGGVSW